MVTPTLAYVRNSPTGEIDLSMKTASLMIVLLTPMAAAGLGGLAADLRGRDWRGIACALLLGAGFAQTLAYIGQFPLVRFMESVRRGAKALPLDYCRALEWIRVSRPRDAVVIDGVRLGSSFPPNISTTLFLAGRLPFLARSGTFAANRLDPDLSLRNLLWGQWETGGFTDRQLSTYFARRGDWLVLSVTLPSLSGWEERFRSGQFTVYAAKRK